MKEVKEGYSLNDLPGGYMGKMLVYKSGKVKMKLGDAMFDVSIRLLYLSPHNLARCISARCISICMALTALGSSIAGEPRY